MPSRIKMCKLGAGVVVVLSTLYGSVEPDPVIFCSPYEIM